MNVLLALALNLHPRSNDSHVIIPGTGVGGLPVAASGGSLNQPRLTLEFVRRRAACLPGIACRVEFTICLLDANSWTALCLESVSPIPASPRFERVVVTDWLPASPAQFRRRRITQP